MSNPIETKTRLIRDFAPRTCRVYCYVNMGGSFLKTIMRLTNSKINQLTISRMGNHMIYVLILCTDKMEYPYFVLKSFLVIFVRIIISIDSCTTLQTTIVRILRFHISFMNILTLGKHLEILTRIGAGKYRYSKYMAKKNFRLLATRDVQI